MDSLTRSTWNNRIERERVGAGSWERTGQEDCRPGTDSTKAEARGATVATAEAEAATDHWHGERTAWASANERAGVTAEEIQRSAAQRSVVQCSAVLESSWKRTNAGSGQRAEGIMQCGADGGSAAQCVVGMGGQHAEEREHAGRPGESEGDCASSLLATTLHFLLA
jgi:hypothetical protein